MEKCTRPLKLRESRVSEGCRSSSSTLVCIQPYTKNEVQFLQTLKFFFSMTSSVCRTKRKIGCFWVSAGNSLGFFGGVLKGHHAREEEAFSDECTPWLAHKNQVFFSCSHYRRKKKSSRDKESNCQHFARKIASCLTGNDYFKEKPHCCSKTTTFLCRVFAELLVSKETWGVVLGS